MWGRRLSRPTACFLLISACLVGCGEDEPRLKASDTCVEWMDASADDKARYVSSQTNLGPADVGRLDRFCARIRNPEQYDLPLTKIVTLRPAGTP